MKGPDLIPPHRADHEIMRTAEVAKLLGVSPTTVANWSREGRLPKPIRLGTKTLAYNVGQLRAALLRLSQTTVASGKGEK